ncbi:hypothetical protein [Polyangium jinanense]|uniref:Lipoprotein n=1 Tax=Polyangium jinanense TaxID=2829994 RepID=A0A9X3XCY8_9BACT|nr:hypothetical protein [Polyangium jinanense]MDC3961384.1 hypothetical protein [Polyangium jinanense]MDC3986985.1 hypothetical protein [Polyangium jinanense]
MNILRMALLCFLTLPACSSDTGRNVFSSGGGFEGGEGGAGGGAASSSSSASSGSGDGGGASCGPSLGLLSFHGVRTTSFDNTTAMVSGTYSNPNDSTLSAYWEADGMLQLHAENADWEVELSLQLGANIDPPLTITPVSFPHSVYGACFSSGIGMGNSYCADDAFEVTVDSLECNHIQGSFKGRAISLNDLYFLDVDMGTFDVPIGSMP